MGFHGFVTGCLATVLLVGRASAASADARLDRLISEERFSEAFRESVAALAARLDREGARDPATLAALQRVGAIAHLAGDQRTAEDVLSALLSAEREVLAANDPAIAETLVTRGHAARYRGDRQLARECYDEAAQVLEAAPRAPATLTAQFLQSEADWWRGRDLTKSIAFYRKALAVRGAACSEPDFAAVDNLTWLAWTLNRAGERDEAKTLAARAKAQLSRLGLNGHSLHATLDNLLAENLAIDGKLREAVPLFRSTATIAETARGKQLGGYSRRGFPLDGYEPLALDALLRGHGDEAWTLLERGRAPSHVDFATLARWNRWDPASYREWQRTHTALKEAKRELLAASGRNPGWTPSSARRFVGVLTLRAKAYDLERRYLDAFRPVAPSLAKVRSLLGPKDAIVGWLEVNFGGDRSPTTWPQRSRGWAFVLRSDRPISWISLWDTRNVSESRDLVQAIPNVFEMLRRAASWPRRVDSDPALVPQLRAWSKIMLDPLLPHLAGVEHVIIDGRFDGSDLSVLLDGRTFGDVFDVSHVPSALVYSLLADEQGASRHAPAILAVSGPSEPSIATVASLLDMDEVSRSQREFRSAYRRDDTPLEKLPRLRYAALEAEAVGAKFDRRVILGNPASSDETLESLASRGRLREFSVVHIAAHTLTDGAPEQCALALGTRSDHGAGADGLLEVEDILLGWQLDADLMTLSGCETLRAAGEGRGEPFGFTPALFASGARRVLSSLWSVDDRATTILMDRFYENYTGRFAGSRLGYASTAMPASRALREAKTYVRTLTDAKGRRPFEHPAYWAGFLLAGLP